MEGGGLTRGAIGVSVLGGESLAHGIAPRRVTARASAIPGAMHRTSGGVARKKSIIGAQKAHLEQYFSAFLFSTGLN